MKEIKKITQVKKGREWVTSYEETDITAVHTQLAEDLIAKKLNCCSYIKSIKRVNNYDGTQTITVNYDNGVRSLYTIRN